MGINYLNPIHSLKSLQKIVGGEILGDPDCKFSFFCKDTREVSSTDIGFIFIAIKGENSDGHTFISQAQKSGAAAAIVSRFIEHSPIPLLKVDNVYKALTDWAKHLRLNHKNPIVGVTGSVGKTTVKNMLYHILSNIKGRHDEQKQVLVTKGNFNNALGVPLMMSCLQDQSVAVFELGANHIGEITDLVRLLRPNISLLLGASEAHIGEFGSLNNIVKAKGEIFNTLTKNDFAILPADSKDIYYWKSISCKKTKNLICFSIDKINAIKSLEFASICVYADNIDENIHHSKCNIYVLQKSEYPIGYEIVHQAPLTIPLPSSHNISNACAAISVCIALNIDFNQAIKYLHSVPKTKGRLDSHLIDTNSSNFTLIDDSYNAGPEAVRSAISLLGKCDAHKVMMLGFMAELGSQAQELHQEMATRIINANINEIWLIGEDTKCMIETLSPHLNVLYFVNADELINNISSNLQNQLQLWNNSTILIKGSLSSKVYTIVDYLKSKNT